MADNLSKQNRTLKILIVCSIMVILFLILVNGVAGYLLYTENMEKEALKKQLQDIKTIKPSE